MSSLPTARAGASTRSSRGRSRGSWRSNRSTGGSPTTTSRPARWSRSGTSAGGATGTTSPTQRRVMTSDELFIVRVRDDVNPALAAHEGCAYESPPQPREQALTLVRALLGYTAHELNGSERWSCPVAGGRRSIWITPQNGPDRLRQSTT